MNATDYEDLMQRVLDGAATAEEEAQLQAALETDAQLRSRYNDLQRLFGVLESVCELEPPPGAMEEVLSQVRQHVATTGQAVSKQGHGHWLGGSWDALRRRLSPQLGYAFATGALAGLALFAVVNDQPLSRLGGGTPGTLIPKQLIGEARPIDTVELQAEGFQGVLRTRILEGGALLAELECSSRVRAAVLLEWEAGLGPVLGFEQESPAGSFRLEPRGLEIEQQGNNRYHIWFGAPPQSGAPIRVRVVVGGTALERAVRTVSEEF